LQDTQTVGAADILAEDFVSASKNVVFDYNFIYPSQSRNLSKFGKT